MKILKAFTLIELLICIAIVAVLAAIVVGVAGSSNSRPVLSQRVQSKARTVEIDGCEYLVFGAGPGTPTFFILHKGNCTNMVHVQGWSE